MLEMNSYAQDTADKIQSVLTQILLASVWCLL